MAQATQVLVVDDDVVVRTMLEAALRPHHDRVDSAASASAALSLLEQIEYDVLLLDLRLGDTNGIDILQQIKQRWPTLEVILLTAHSSINSAIQAVRYGAFDYLLKPVQINDIRACVERGLQRRRAALHRGVLLQHIGESLRVLELIDTGAEVSVAPPIPSRVDVGSVILDVQRYSATIDGQPLGLTRIEFKLLVALVQQHDQTLSYSTLSEAAYGRIEDEEDARALLRPHITRLRNKIEATGASRVTLVSVRSVGYMLKTD